jgi:hypothetical protein
MDFQVSIAIENIIKDLRGYISVFKRKVFIGITEKTIDFNYYSVNNSGIASSQGVVAPVLPTPDENDWRSPLLTYDEPRPPDPDPCVEDYLENQIANLYKGKAFLTQDNLATIQSLLADKVGEKVEVTVVPSKLTSGVGCTAVAGNEISVKTWGIPANVEVVAASAIEY